jgi:hypothetical protein
MVASFVDHRQANIVQQSSSGDAIQVVVAFGLG